MQKLSEVDVAKASAHWGSKKTTSPNWWTNDLAMRHHNQRISGVPERWSVSGVFRLIQAQAKFKLRTCISVGSGLGTKEVALVKSGVVESVIGYELSPIRVASANERAAAEGLSDRVEFRCADAFADNGPYDMVFWAGSLHHMPDVREATRWSRSVLRPGGLYAISEYVGPTRFELDAESLSRVNRLRALLPKRLFENGRRPLPLKVDLDHLASACKVDPSEACDSGTIMPAFHEYFPNGVVRDAGGLFYFIGLAGMYQNLDMSSEDDVALLRTVLMMDELCDSPSLLTAAVAVKE